MRTRWKIRPSSPFPAPSRPAALPVPAERVVFAAGGYGRFGVRRAGLPTAATRVPVRCRSLRRGGGQWSAAAGPGAGVRAELWPRAAGWVRLGAPDGRCPAARSSPSGHPGWCLNGPVGICDLCKTLSTSSVLNTRGKVFQSLSCGNALNLASLLTTVGSDDEREVLCSSTSLLPQPTSTFSKLQFCCSF